MFYLYFVCNVPAPTGIYTLSLHDALPISPDGKTVEFDFVDVAGGTQYGHMHHALFTIIDAKDRKGTRLNIIHITKSLAAFSYQKQTKDGSVFESQLGTPAKP